MSIHLSIPNPPSAACVPHMLATAPVPRPNSYRAACWSVVASLWMTLGAAHLHGADTNPEPFHVGFSRTLFLGLHENDARASVKAWGHAVAAERGVPIDPEAVLFDGMEEMLRSLRAKAVDAVSLNVLEYNRIRHEIPMAPIFVTVVAEKPTLQYVLLARAEGKIKTLADLRGSKLLFHSSAGSCLARMWLDVLLVRQGLPLTGTFVSQITSNPKLTTVVLPVFFSNADACVVPRDGFEAMAELNTQVGRQLKVLATSEDLVPVVLGFRADYKPPFLGSLLSGLRELPSTPAGQQVLTVFRSEAITDVPPSSLNGTLEFLATHARLCGGTNPPNPGASGSGRSGQGEDPGRW